MNSTRTPRALTRDLAVIENLRSGAGPPARSRLRKSQKIAQFIHQPFDDQAKHIAESHRQPGRQLRLITSVKRLHSSLFVNAHIAVRTAVSGGLSERAYHDGAGRTAPRL